GGHRVLRGLPGRLVEQPDELAERFADRLGVGPAGQGLGGGGDERGAAAGGGGGGRGAGGGGRRGPAARARSRPARGAGAGGAELPAVRRGEEVGVGFGLTGALQGGVVGAGGEEDDRDAPLGPEPRGGGDAVHGAGQRQGDQGQVRPRLGGQAQGLFAGRG